MDLRSLEDDFASHFMRIYLIRAKSLSAVHGSDETCPTADAELEYATDAFRWLRNHSPRLSSSAKHELLESGLVPLCCWFCDHYFVDVPLSRSVLLQFLANFSVNHCEAQRIVFQDFNGTLRNFISSSDDSKLLNNSIMLLYNLCLYNTHFRQDVLKDEKVIKKIMEHWTHNEIEYSKIFLDSIFSSSEDFLCTYTNLSYTSKEQLTSMLSIWLDHYIEDVSLDVIYVIIDNFFINCTVEEITNNIVNVLAKASSIEKFKSDIKQHTPLLKKSMDILITIHEQGKDSNNDFSPVKGLSDLLVNFEIQKQHRFWFKSDIIRLIANMCYNHKEHQHLMGVNNIIPILLECCSFDAKNPLMREWSLFALKNILEGNLDNQNFVANIDSVGVIDPESSVKLTNTSQIVTADDSISNYVKDV